MRPSTSRLLNHFVLEMPSLQYVWDIASHDCDSLLCLCQDLDQEGPHLTFGPYSAANALLLYLDSCLFFQCSAEAKLYSNLLDIARFVELCTRGDHAV